MFGYKNKTARLATNCTHQILKSINALQGISYVYLHVSFSEIKFQGMTLIYCFLITNTSQQFWSCLHLFWSGGKNTNGLSCVRAMETASTSIRKQTSHHLKSLLCCFAKIVSGHLHALLVELI